MITELTQDWENRCLEGTKKTLCAPVRGYLFFFLIFTFLYRFSTVSIFAWKKNWEVLISQISSSIITKISILNLPVKSSATALVLNYYLEN